MRWKVVKAYLNIITKSIRIIEVRETILINKKKCINTEGKKKRNIKYELQNSTVN